MNTSAWGIQNKHKSALTTSNWKKPRTPLLTGRISTCLAFTHSPGQKPHGNSLFSIHGSSAGCNWEITSGLKIVIPDFWKIKGLNYLCWIHNCVPEIHSNHLAFRRKRYSRTPHRVVPRISPQGPIWLLRSTGGKEGGFLWDREWETLSATRNNWLAFPDRMQIWSSPGESDLEDQRTERTKSLKQHKKVY